MSLNDNFNDKVATLRDLAGIAGVSVTTVSRALRDKPDIGLDTRLKIKQLARQLNYHPHEVARSLVLQRTNTIGLTMSHLDNPYYGQLSQEIEAQAAKAGYSLLLTIASSTIEKSTDFLNRKKVDGFILGPVLAGQDVSGLWALRKTGVPVVFHGNIDLPEMDTVIVDAETAVCNAVRYLAERGHRDMGFLGRTRNNLILTLKFGGFQRGLLESGLQLKNEWVVETRGELEDGYARACALLQQDKLPTAVFCHNDLLALGVLHALAERGMRCPDDMAVVGFDNIEMSAYSNPPLTTIEQPVERIASELVRLLSDRISNPAGEREQVVLLPSLTVRKST
ncbi:MAG: LacI family DNA-binding transcriptional regulator [bacterium]|nr:LacI family DNA-binding transcriptional regulator [bacterium]